MNNEKLKLWQNPEIITEKGKNDKSEIVADKQMQFGRFVPDKVKEVSLSKYFIQRETKECVLFKNCAKLFDFGGRASRSEW